MGSSDAKSWRTVRGGRPLSEKRMNTYQRLTDAEGRLDAMRRRRGLRDTAMADALDAIEGGGDQIEPEDDLYLRTIARYVTELGGRIEVVAVFPEETVTLLSEPAPATGM
ncbi:MAG TPA: hypothetical protein VMF57_10200 [Solirubrobacteraceae bacterium]|nr:hypothetical protein [Solirubrobacteraceae bacterium]